MSINKVIISGGGSGGHIFPAIAIANRIKLEYPNADILFIGAEGKMEMTKVPEAGYKIEGLWISGLQRRLTLKYLALSFKLMASLLKGSAKFFTVNLRCNPLIQSPSILYPASGTFVISIFPSAPINKISALGYSNLIRFAIAIAGKICPPDPPPEIITLLMLILFSFID